MQLLKMAQNFPELAHGQTFCHEVTLKGAQTQFQPWTTTRALLGMLVSYLLV
jgi:hypothetical protein